MNIGLIGGAGSGKDTLTDYIINKYGYTRYAFADKVKTLAAEWFPEHYNEANKPRHLLQHLGMSFREIDPDVWIRTMFDDIDKNYEYAIRLNYQPDAIIVTDTRLPNEYEALKERGFKFIRVSVDKEICEQRMIQRGDVFNSDNMNHVTESYYDMFEVDYEITNNGTLEELKQQTDKVVEMLMQSH